MKTGKLLKPGDSTPLKVLKSGRLMAIAAIVFLACQPLRSQDLPFNSGSTGADGAFHVNVPFSPGRYGAGMAFDAARSQMVLFGGFAGSLTNDTWIWQGADWIKLNPITRPPAMLYHSMVYDPDRREVVLFGGATSLTSSGATNATWIWNGTNWGRKTPANSPSGRIFTAMTYDKSRHEILLFGGGDAGGLLLNDTWIWNGTNWSERTTLPISPPPSPRYTAAMAYDETNQQVVLFGGFVQGPVADTWIWDGTNWVQRFPANSPPARNEHSMDYDAVHHRIVVFGGNGINDTWLWDGSDWKQQNPWHAPPVRSRSGAAYDSVRSLFIVTGGSGFADTWAWDGKDWLAVSGGGYQTVDARTKPDGVWNFSTITIPANLTVLFNNNPGNTPMRWLATGNVTIGGTIDLSGQAGGPGGLNVVAHEGGPGGFAGGLGGLPSFQGSPFAGTPGQGPGGGVPGADSAQAGQSGTYATTYGSPFIQPLLGGSGGGGSGSTVNNSGNLGGGGGGALLLSSSRDITINGTIRANGGAGYGGSGAGSAGAARFRADRITLSAGARLEATNDGRIRFEAYERSLIGTILPTNAFSVVASLPVAEPAAAQAALRIASVAGQNVVLSPGGDSQNTDVTFSSPGDIAVTVQGQNIPDRTPVRLRVTMVGSVINKPAAGEPPILLSGGTAIFTLTVPRGQGTIQAFAEFTVP